MKAEEIINFLNSLDLEIIELAYDCNNTIQDEIKEKCGDFEYVLEGEVQNSDLDTIHSVIHFKDHDVYIGFSGQKDSWAGDEWDFGPTEVKPKKITITTYE